MKVAVEVKILKGPTETKTKQKNLTKEELKNSIKSVQTAFSSIDVETTKCKYCEIKSKSQEELTKITKKQEVITRRDLGNGDLPQNATEWFEIQSNKLKVKMCGEKIQKLAEKLKQPGGEEKLRMQIEKYLKKVPEQFADGDDDKAELLKYLPDDIIRKLKKINIKRSDTNLNVYRMELFKYCTRFKIDNFKRVILNWLKHIHIKKKDFLGRNVKKDDVFNYVADKLEPLVLDRPKSDTEYKNALKTNITEIIEDLPLNLGSRSKENYVSKVTETLVNDIFSLEKAVPSTYIQPTLKEIKEFIKNEITFFLEKSHVAISTKRMECLETELIDVLLDIKDIVDIDQDALVEISTILKGIGKLSELKAKYFANILLKDYKEFFFRSSNCQEKTKSDSNQTDFCAEGQNAGNVNDQSSMEVYTIKLVEEISNWLSEINIPGKDKHFKDMAVKTLATNIVDKYNSSLSNLNTKEPEGEESEKLKYEIFDWINKLVGKNNPIVLNNVKELAERINNIPKPTVPNTTKKEDPMVNSNVVAGSNDDGNISAESNPVIEKLTNEIHGWVQELPVSTYVAQYAHKRHIAAIALDIEKKYDKNNTDSMNEILYDWTRKSFNNKLCGFNLETLKTRIKNVLDAKDNDSLKENLSLKDNEDTEENIDSSQNVDARQSIERNPKQEKLLIRTYEDIVDEWVDHIPIDSKNESIYIENKNELIHELAVKIYKVKTKLIQSEDEVMEHKLKEEILTWLQKLPLDPQADTTNDEHAAKLMKSIQEHNTNDLIEIPSFETDNQLEATPVETAIFDWFKNQSLYQNKSIQDRLKQEAIIKELAIQLKETPSEISEADEIIFNHIKLLDPKLNDNEIQTMALKLKKHLRNLQSNVEITSQPDDTEAFLINTNIEEWINSLRLKVRNVDHFKNQTKDFVDSLIQMNKAGCGSDVIKKEIITFIKTLPIDYSKKINPKFLEQEASKLLRNSGIARIEQSLNNIQQKHTISEAIKHWTKDLPLKSVYCPDELRLFIDDMSIVITSLMIHPEYTTTEENDNRLYREIVKFLKRFPLLEEVNTDYHISNLAEELAKLLKDIHSKCCANIDDDLKKHSSFVVPLKCTNDMIDLKSSFRNIHDYNANSDAYTRKLVHQITEWFTVLNFRNTHKDNLAEIVINDLACDIVDRRKYLELNPKSRGTAEDELEYLKYQIFKWINKLVGDEDLRTIDNANDLMQRIQNIPVPALLRPQDKYTKENPSTIDQDESRCSSPWQDLLLISKSHSSQGSFGQPIQAPALTCCPLRSDNKPSDNKTMSDKNANILEKSDPRSSPVGGKGVGFSASPEKSTVKNMAGLKAPGSPTSPEKAAAASGGRATSPARPSSPPRTLNKKSSPTTPADKVAALPDESSLPPPVNPSSASQANTKEAIYEKYQQIFRQKCDLLPIDSATPESAQLADLAKTSIYNGIIKTFFKLKSDPEIENDYGYFEFLLEEKIEEMLDVLPQTSELIDMRYAWKIDILSNAIDMLDELHNLLDRPSFRQRVRSKFNRKFAKDQEVEQCFLMQQGFLAEMANAYILETKYKEDNPLKAKIYKRRLMNKIDDFANHLSREHNVGFRFFKKPQLARVAMKVLEQVPIPTDDILQEEAEEIELADRVEHWYKHLPTKPLINDTDGLLRKRMMDLLARKLYDIDKRVNDDDPSKETQMKHEMSQFLERRAKLQDDEDLNINEMADILYDSIKNKRPLKDPVNYDEFVTGMPLCSTFAQGNKTLLPTAMDVGIAATPKRVPAFEQCCQVGEANNSTSLQGNPARLTDISQIVPIPSCCHSSTCGTDQGNLPQNQSFFPPQEPPRNTYPGRFPNELGSFMSSEANFDASPCGPHCGLMPRLRMPVPHLQNTNAMQGQLQRPDLSPTQSHRKGCYCAAGRQHPPDRHSRCFNNQTPHMVMKDASHKMNSNVHRGRKDSPRRTKSPTQHEHRVPCPAGQNGPRSCCEPTIQVPYGAPAVSPHQRQFQTAMPGFAPDQKSFPGYGDSNNQPTSGTSDEMIRDYMDSEYVLKCRCLEAYRRRKKMFKEAEDRCYRNHNKSYKRQ